MIPVAPEAVDKSLSEIVLTYQRIEGLATSFWILHRYHLVHVSEMMSVPRKMRTASGHILERPAMPTCWTGGVLSIPLYSQLSDIIGSTL
jgi:hypothetical protein